MKKVFRWSNGRVVWLTARFLAAAILFGTRGVSNGEEWAWINLTGAPGGRGNANGIGALARFDNPSSVSLDSAGNVYVVDSGNNEIGKITPSGAVSTVAGSSFNHGSADGSGQTARFYLPSGGAVDANGNLYVADTG